MSGWLTLTRCLYSLCISFIRIKKESGLSPSRQTLLPWQFLWLPGPAYFQLYFLRAPGSLCLHGLMKPMMYLPSWKLPPCPGYPAARRSPAGAQPSLPMVRLPARRAWLGAVVSAPATIAKFDPQHPSEEARCGAGHTALALI